MLVRRLLTIIIIITPGLVNIFLLAGLIDTITCTAAHAIHNLYYMFNLHIFFIFCSFIISWCVFILGGRGGASQPSAEYKSRSDVPILRRSLKYVSVLWGTFFFHISCSWVVTLCFYASDREISDAE